MILLFTHYMALNQEILKMLRFFLKKDDSGPHDYRKMNFISYVSNNRHFVYDYEDSYLGFVVPKITTLPPSDFYSFYFFSNFHQRVRLFGIILVCSNLLNPKGLCASHKQRVIIVWYWSQLIALVCLIVPCSQLHILGCT